jgi:hypothetical protein
MSHLGLFQLLIFIFIVGYVSLLLYMLSNLYLDVIFLSSLSFLQFYTVLLLCSGMRLSYLETVWSCLVLFLSFFFFLDGNKAAFILGLILSHYQGKSFLGLYLIPVNSKVFWEQELFPVFGWLLQMPSFVLSGGSFPKGLELPISTLLSSGAVSADFPGPLYPQHSSSIILENSWLSARSSQLS